MTIRITRMKKAGLALLSKRISLGEDGRPVSYGSPCRMTNGSATRVTLDWGTPANDLAALILDLGSHEALVLGDHSAQDDTIEIVLKEHVGPGRYGRSLDTFQFNDGEPAVTLLDHDQKAMPESVRAVLEEHGGFEGALTSLIPSYPTLARVTRASTSAGLRNEETGETFPGNGGQHVYLFAQNGADIPRFLEDLQKRAWLTGMGWIMVSARGSLLIRSIVDVTVGSPERLVFEGAPRVAAPLVQDPEARRPVAHEGELLDTAAACPPLTPDEERRYNELVEAAKLAAKPEAEAAKEQAAEEISSRRGIDIEKARAVVTASTQGELWSWDTIEFDDDALGVVSVAELLADPGRFHGETAGDPLEGSWYGRGKAKVYWNRGNEVICNSFAHGGFVYRLRHDADYIELKVEEAGENAPYVLAAHMPHAQHLDPVAKERLRDLAAKAGKVGLRAVSGLIKEECQKAKRQALAAHKARGGDRVKGGEAGSNRQELVILAGQRPEQLRTIVAKLRIPSNVGPGAIVVRGQATVVLRHAIDPARLRAGNQEIELPAGSAYLAQAKPEHLQAQLDVLFAFAKVNKEGEQYATDCPADLARYVIANANLLTIHSISRTPVLRSDGSVLDQPGYDPATAIFYAPDETFPPVPSEPTQEDAAAALERLRRPFRGFPFVTDADRDAVAAEVLTLLTRHLVPRVPAFVHNAVEAGSGKTKIFDTVSIIALGTNAALLNADILDDETELKKVLTTLTLAASPLAVFDNVARGGQITSPGLSNYLTATVYGDRLLGSNTEVKAATCTVIGMTGNAVEVSGDNTRRMFRVDLDAGVERPETREFDFDCEAEARQDRGELVVAALTILRAHALARWPTVPNRPALGSFEDWDRFVAGAIVFAGGSDVVTLLDKTRAADPERDDLAEVLRMLEDLGATSPMKTGEIIRTVEEKKAEALNNTINGKPSQGKPSEWHELLCRLGREGSPEPRRLGRYLTKNAGRITADLQLISEPDTHAKVSRYYVRRLENGRDCGVAGFSGVSGSPFQSRENLNETHGSGCDTAFLNNNGSDRPSETPHNPQTPHRHANGHHRCAHCNAPIEPGIAGTTVTSDGSYLHYRCVDAWAQQVDFS